MRDNCRWQIAIDGPAGAGKSTVAKAVAKRLGMVYLDTGAMYRALAFKALQQGVSVGDEAEVSALAEMIRIAFSPEGRVWCDDQDVTEEIRQPEVSKSVSVVASYPQVRKKLVELQRAEARRGGVVMDGRDIGTHVLPNADLKIFLTADPLERAYRRWLELKRSGKDLTLEEVAQDMAERDRQDTEREAAPLVAARDAILLDTTGLSVETIIEQIIELVREGH